MFKIRKFFTPVRLQRGDYLLIFRCGEQSPCININSLKNHNKIDILFSAYQIPNFDFNFDNAYLFYGGLSKYHAFKKIWYLFPEVQNYTAYWFLDYDIEFEEKFIIDIIEEGLKENLDIWQPALDNKSYTKWKVLYKLPHRIGIRRTNFIEVMAPIFSSNGLRKCIETFDESISTWGLDFVWSKLLRGENMGVSDTYCMSHTKKPDVKKGPFYQYLKSISINPHKELLKLRVKHRIWRLMPQNNIIYYIKLWSLLIKKTDNEINFKDNSFLLNLQKTQVVFFLNHYSLYILCIKCIDLLYNNIFVYVDGYLLARFFKLKQGRNSFDLTGGADIIFKICSQNNINVVFIGGTEEEKISFSKKIKKLFPDLKFIVFNGYFDEEKIIEIAISQVKENNAKVIILGLGTPKQEIIAMKIASQAKSYKFTIFTCGGFISQTAKSPKGIFYPEFINKMNLRWLWRCIKQPFVIKRLPIYFKSYLLVRKANH